MGCWVGIDAFALFVPAEISCVLIFGSGDGLRFRLPFACRFAGVASPSGEDSLESGEARATASGTTSHGLAIFACVVWRL